jgi:peroxiredoxin
MAIEERLAEEAEDADVQEMSADDIDESFVPIPRDNVVGVEIEGEAVLLIEGTWTIHWLNQIGTVVWESLDGVTSVEGLSKQLSKQFGADPEQVLNDVLEVTQRFGRAGMLVGVAESTQAAGSQGVRVGTQIESFELPNLEGQTVSLESFRGEKLLLVNWSPVCGFCRKLAPELAEIEPELLKQGVRPVFVAIGEAEANREFMKEFGLTATLLLQEPHEVEAFFGMGTPVAYLIDEEGKTASELAYGAEHVPALAREAAGLPPKESADDGHDEHEGHDHKH